MEQDACEERWPILNSTPEVKCRLVKVEMAQCLDKLNCTGR